VSTIVAIADAVVSELNAGGFIEPFTAQRLYHPQFELTDMDTLHVTVVPQGVSIEPAGRNINQYDYRIDVAVQKRFSEGDAAELDPLMQLVEAIVDYFRFKRLQTPEAAWVKTENAPIYSPEHMEQLRQFTSVVTLTFRVIR